MMKRTLQTKGYVLLLFSMIIACSKEIPNNDNNSSDNMEEVMIEPVKSGFARALDFAKTAPSEIYGKKIGLTKSGEPEVIPGEPVMNPRAGALRAKSLDNDSLVQDTLMYVFNYANDEGYIVIATDEWGAETMVFGDSGNFNVRDTAGNPLASFLVNRMIDYLLYNDEPRYTELSPEEIEKILAEEQPETKSLVMGNTYKDGQKLIGYYGNGHIAQWVMQNYDSLDFGTPCNPPGMIEGVPGTPDQGGSGTGNPNELDPEIYYKRDGCILRTQSTTQGKETRVGPLLKTKWGQGYPYNDYTMKYAYGYTDIDSDDPKVHRADTGCGATAIAQILAYHRYPETYPFTVSFNGYDALFNKYGDKVDSILPGTDPKYYLHMCQKPLNRKKGDPTYLNLLEDFPTKDILTSKIKNSKTARYGVSQLMRIIGEKIEMWYTYDNGSGVWKMWFSGAQQFIDFFKAYGYKGDPYLNDHKITESFWMIKKSINEGLPVLAWAFTDAVNTKGHIWVIDGYLSRPAYTDIKWDYRFDELYRYNGCIGPYGGGYNCFENMHCNFGWNEKHDGYYNAGIFTVQSSDGPDTYKYKLKFIPYIQPDK